MSNTEAQPTGGSPDHLLQDQCRDLSRALAGKPDARLHATEAAAALAQPAASGEPVAWYVKRVAPGKRDDGMRLGPWWVRTQAEGWADDRHVLCALYATAQPAPAPAELLQQKFNEGRQFEQERQAAIHAQPAPALVPPGWVLVPVEPTPEMRQAAVKVICYGPEGGFTRISGPDRCWSAMLASAPDAPQSQPPEVTP